MRPNSPKQRMIICVFYEINFRRASAVLQRQGDILGGGHRCVPAHAYLIDIGPDEYQNKQGEVLGDGHRSVPTHLWLMILCLISGDAYHARRAIAGLKKQGDILGGGHRSCFLSHQYLEESPKSSFHYIPSPVISYHWHLKVNFSDPRKATRHICYLR